MQQVTVFLEVPTGALTRIKVPFPDIPNEISRIRTLNFYLNLTALTGFEVHLSHRDDSALLRNDPGVIYMWAPNYVQLTAVGEHLLDRTHLASGLAIDVAGEKVFKVFHSDGATRTCIVIVTYEVIRVPEVERVRLLKATGPRN